MLFVVDKDIKVRVFSKEHQQDDIDAVQKFATRSSFVPGIYLAHIMRNSGPPETWSISYERLRPVKLLDIF